MVAAVRRLLRGIGTATLPGPSPQRAVGAIRLGRPRPPCAPAFTPRDLAAAAHAYDVLSRCFRNGDVATWREPRRMYEVEAQGAGSSPDLPFFDRGTWEQSVGLAP